MNSHSADKAHVPSDEDLDALVLLIRDAARGGCGSHEGCRALVAKKQRDAARRWFIGANLRLPSEQETP